MAGYAFSLVNGMVIQVTQSGTAYDQLVQNRFDVLIANISTGVTAAGLITSVQGAWTTSMVGLLSTQYVHVQTKVQLVTDVVPGVSSPKRVYGPMYSVGPTTSQNGTDANETLPQDVAMSVSLVTTGAPGPYWGAKRFGPLPVSLVNIDGEQIEGGAALTWETNMALFFNGTHFISATTATWEVVVVPATEIAALPLPHAALSTLVKDVIAINIPTYVGSQGTRRITPTSLRGH